MELFTGAIGSLLPKLGELLKKEYHLQKGVKKKIQKLSRELEEAHAVLRKIGDVPRDQLDEQVRLWAHDVREASYDMEDIVDTFLVRVVDAPEPTDEAAGKLRRLWEKVGSLLEKSKARREISGHINDINEKLEEVAARRGRYTVDNIKPAAATTIDPRVLNLYKRAAELVGIEGPRDELISMLSLGGDDGDVSADKKMKIVSIVGFGGLGKTTLAKAVYDRVKPRFQCGAFIPVGQNPDMKKVLRDILIGLDEEKYTYSNLNGLDENQLMDRLNRFIKDKRCFIVIDDIWDKGSWGLIRCALQESNCASRFVTTTRIYEVASHANDVYKMKPLSHDNSEKLLLARIAGGEGKSFDNPSIEARENILKKCNGVPLAIITIASLLASKPGEDWSEVYKSIGFGHGDNDDVSNTRRILSFSYYDLPSHLKACLLYLSVFPEEAVIEKNSLIWMWTAEGFITEEQAAAAGVGLYEFSERCFNELINRSMIQAQEREYDGYVNACSVHDMVLDLIHQLSREENFVTVLNGGGRQKLQGGISRRLALQRVEEHNADELANINVEKVRSIFTSCCDFAALCPRLSFLRVVEMVRCSVSNDDCQKLLLDHLGSLLHLRYLRLEKITELPKEVGYLRFLQTLDLWGSTIKELPEEVGHLTQLFCLRAQVERTVPAGLIGKLRSLQELAMWRSFGDEDAEMQFVKELGLLRELRVLKTSINVTSESMESALLESLGHMCNIQELTIKRSTLYNCSQTIGAGSVSCRHLRLLRLYSLVFSQLPAWINSLLSPNLFYLEVNVRVVREQDVETLARLPQLECLILQCCTEVVSIKIATDGAGYFHKLRKLIIHGCSSVFFDLCGGGGSSGVPSNTIMPSLESLVFEVHVRSLKDENPHLGFDKQLCFHYLGTSSLQSVHVIMCCGFAFLREVEEAEAALEQAAAVHPKHPTLQTRREETYHMISRYHQEACMKVNRNPALIYAAWKSGDIVSPGGNIQVLRMPDPIASPSKVIRLLYTDDGATLLALSSNALHKMWKWEHSDKNPLGKSSESVPPVLWQPESGVVMTNDTINGNPEEANVCIALSKSDEYIISASGGKVSKFSMKEFKVETTFMPPLPAATFLAFYPKDNDIVAIGRDDSSIQIYNGYYRVVLFVLMGHHKKITGLAFSPSMKVLVSSGADAQLCIWSIGSSWYPWWGKAWKKWKSTYIQPRSIHHSGPLAGDTMVQFHFDGTQILVVHETQLAIYDCQLKCLRSWIPRYALPVPAPISSAVYSIGCLLVYAGFCDGAIGIFEAESLTWRCRIAPSAYIPSSVSSGGGTVYPTVVAVHPWKPNQIAVGMSDGAVHVLESLDRDDVQVESDASSGQCSLSDINNSDGESQPDVI